MAVRETLELDLRTALAGLTQIDRALATASARFATALAEALSQLDTKVEVDADVAGVSDAIDEAVSEADATVGVEVDADVSDAEDEIQGLEASAPDITIEVDADVGPAEDSIADLGTAARGAAKDTSDLGGAVSGLQVAAGLAVGETASLADGVAGISGKTAGAVTGLLAVAATTKSLFDNALEAIGAEQRLRNALGDLAAQIETINVGSLNADLSALAIKLGSSDDAIRDSVTSLFQFGTSSGHAREEVAKTTEQVVALAARAVALNPALGDVGAVAETMSLRLARGGRFAAQFGIALNAADIEARAREMFHLSGEVGVYERVAAAADLATQKYGASLKRDIEEGSKNPILQLRSLKTEVSEFGESVGRPLVVPIIDAFRTAIPTIETFAAAIGKLAAAGLPLVVAALEVITPAVQVFADVLDAIPTPVLTITAVVGALYLAVTSLAVALGGLSVAELAVAAATTDIGLSVSTAVPAIAAFTASFLATQAVLKKVGFGAEDLSDDMAALDARADSLAKLADVQLVPALNNIAASLGKLNKNGVGPVSDRLFAFQTIAERNLGTAARLADQIDHTSSEYAAFQRIISRVAASQKQQSEDSERAAVVIAEEGDAFDKAASAADVFKTSMDKLLGVHVSALQAEIDYRQGTEDLTKQLKENANNLDINTAAGRANLDAVLKQTNRARDFSDAILREKGDVAGATAIMETFTQTIREQLIAAGNAPEVVEALLQRLGLLAPQAAQKGGEVGAAFGQGFADGITSKRIDALGAAGLLADAAALAMNTALETGSPSRVAMRIGQQVVEGFAIGLSNTGPVVTASSRLAFATRSAFSASLRTPTGGGSGGNTTSTVDNSFHVGPFTIAHESDRRTANAVVRTMQQVSWLGGR